MRHFFSIFTRAVAALLLVAGVASAGTITLSTPTGLNPGDKFRFLAVTSGTTTATTTSINTYNTFVQTDLGDAVYNGGVVNWKAIGSTSVVDARDNVGGFASPSQGQRLQMISRPTRVACGPVRCSRRRTKP